jgi:hypothetical protein
MNRGETTFMTNANEFLTKNTIHVQHPHVYVMGIMV